MNSDFCDLSQSVSVKFMKNDDIAVLKFLSSNIFPGDSLLIFVTGKQGCSLLAYFGHSD